MVNHFPLVARFNTWSNAPLHDCVAQLPEADYQADRKLFFGSVHRALNHLLAADRFVASLMARVFGG